MTAQVQFIPETQYSKVDLDRFLFELEARFKQKEVMHCKEAAAFLGISVRQLNNLASAGKLKYHRLDGLKGKLFLRTEILEAVKKG